MGACRGVAQRPVQGGVCRAEPVDPPLGGGTLDEVQTWNTAVSDKGPGC